jgi:hypothetical protein
MDSTVGQAKGGRVHHAQQAVHHRSAPASGPPVEWAPRRPALHDLHHDPLVHGHGPCFLSNSSTANHHPRPGAVQRVVGHRAAGHAGARRPRMGLSTRSAAPTAETHRLAHAAPSSADTSAHRAGPGISGIGRKQSSPARATGGRSGARSSNSRALVGPDELGTSSRCCTGACKHGHQQPRGSAAGRAAAVGDEVSAG